MSCKSELPILSPWRPIVLYVLSVFARPVALPFIYICTYSNLFQDMHICIIMELKYDAIF